MISFPYNGATLELPESAVVGVTGRVDEVASLMHAAGGTYVGLANELNVSTTPQLLCVEYRLDVEDEITRFQTAALFQRVRRAGGTVLFATRDYELLRTLADELWWVQHGRVILRGDVQEVHTQYLGDVLRSARAASWAAELDPVLRRGDGRAEVVRIEVLNPVQATTVLSSGHETEIRVTVQFQHAVADPVIGIMIRTRIGMEVYGTNTELEGVSVGPCQAGDKRIVAFRFRCDLCPGYYTLTAASHDPDGVWHDWLEDAVAFTVTDSRYTAGVANLRASVTCSRG